MWGQRRGVPFFPAKSLQSCPTLCDPIDGSPLGSPVPGILQASGVEHGVHRTLRSAQPHLWLPSCAAQVLKDFSCPSLFWLLSKGNLIQDSCFKYTTDMLMTLKSPPGLTEPYWT